MTTHDLYLDLSKPLGIASRITTRVGDKGTLEIQAHITDNGASVTTSNRSARFEAVRKDGSMIRANASLSSSGGDAIAKYTLTANDIAVPGTMQLCYFVILEGTNKVASTENFVIVVEPNAESASTVDYTPYISEVDDLVQELIAIKAQATSATSAANSAASSANNAAGSANEAAAQANTAATRANTAATNAEAVVGAAENEEARVAAEEARVLAEAARAAQFAEMLDSLQGAQIKILTSDQYDSDGVPTIAGAPGLLYFVPIAGTTHNTFTEWAYINGGWEVIGTTNTTIKGVDTDVIDVIASDTTVTGNDVLKTTGLSYLWAKIKAKFAPKSHTHDASDITAGELAAALFADGIITDDMLSAKCVTGAKIADHSIGKDQLETTLWDSISQPCRTMEYTMPAQSWNAGAVGGRVAQQSFNLSSMQGYAPVGATITAIQNSAAAIPVVFISGSRLYINLYSATGEAYRNTTQDYEVKAKVLYIKA